MNKYFKRLVSLSMAFVLIIGGVSINARAESKQATNNYITSEVEISDTTIDMYVTSKNTKQVDILRSVRENNGNYSYYGWLDVGDEKEHINRKSDFNITVMNGSVVYTSKGEAPRVVATIDTKEVENYGNNSKETKSMYPLPWRADTPKYSSVATDVGNAISVAAILAAVAGFGGASTFMSIAALIIANNIPTTYYVRTEYYRVYDPCTQQYYYTTVWYSNPNYTGYIDSSTSDIYERYLC